MLKIAGLYTITWENILEVELNFLCFLVTISKRTNSFQGGKPKFGERKGTKTFL